MCGISSIYRFSGVTESDLEKLRLMNQGMVYRGPDGVGYWNDETCAMAHTRLSIIGVDNGAQPIVDKYNGLVLVCNGEIYNYKELRAELQSKGCRFQTESDCECILYLYKEYGDDCVKFLLGMFAFCLYDTNKKRMLVARDRAGEKILYFSQLPTGVVFSTELKAILTNYINRPQLNVKAFAEAIRYNYALDLRNTFVEEIKRIEAGEYAVVDCDGMYIKRYWKHQIIPSFEGSKDEAKREVVKLMRDSVDKCLQSEVPVAVLLSGGIDSTAIARMAKDTGREIHVISAGYKGDFSVDERSVAKKFASENGLIYHDVELDSDDFLNLFDEEYNFIDDLAFDVSSMSQYALYKKSKELGFKVLLSGIGGDELFYGYPEFIRLAKSLQIRKKHFDMMPLKKHYIEFIKFFFRNIRYVVSAGHPDKIDDAWPVRWTYDDYKKFKKGGSVGFGGDEYLLDDIDVHYSYREDDNIDSVYDFEFTTFMNTLCLYLADRLGMANSLEIRCPLLDYRLIDFVGSLPMNIKFDGNPKGFYKECLKGIVPDDILFAKKRGFEPPFEFIWKMCEKYKYRNIKSPHVFFNSMAADTLLERIILK